MLLGVGLASAVAAWRLWPARASASAEIAWHPFALAAGLLVIGAVAGAEGTFAWLGDLAGRLPGGGPTLYGATMMIVAGVTVLLNLDTAVVFVTPIVLRAARARGQGEEPFLYGCVLMANAASLLLPGSNLTNLIILGDRAASGSAFAASMAAPWAVAVLVTGGGVAVLCRRSFRKVRRLEPVAEPPGRRVALGPGVVGAVAATICILVVPDPAGPVLGIGAAVAAFGLTARKLNWAAVVRALDAATLAGLLGLAVAFGAAAHAWDVAAWPAIPSGSFATAGVASIAAISINNLPAASVLQTVGTAHLRALLLGLNVGPNVAVSGSLAAILWLRVARSCGAVPSARTYSRIGVLVAPAAIAAATLSLSLPSHRPL